MRARGREMVPGRKDGDKAQGRRGALERAAGCVVCLYTAGELVKQSNGRIKRGEKKKPKDLFVFAPSLHAGTHAVGSKADSNFGSYRCIDSACLNRPAAPKVLPWQQDGNGDHNVFMVPATWGLRSGLSGDRTLPRARRVWAKSLHTRQQRNTEEP